ncbi:hypothetical protein CKO_04471 [Citrobacter koseri ATCC BAA-895]|uniref:Uncharacterized protein n=1 Tax=Citrobacter koseri (strain ATCC BAA-895 / CDC 4225-83 / SGSC4696) TaxID=290338 RepID=A8APW3_CITK8|nr:hypothetical protein CKO_04471 [Citrobacter koseri ATCC BAA-895]
MLLAISANFSGLQPAQQFAAFAHNRNGIGAEKVHIWHQIIKHTIAHNKTFPGSDEHSEKQRNAVSANNISCYDVQG